MTLLPKEEKIITANNDKIILSNLRIYMSYKTWGNAYSISVFLEDISSIEVKYKSNIIFVILGLISLAVGALMTERESQAIIIGAATSIVCFLLYRFTRKHVISISSNGGGIANILAEGMKDDKIEEFVHTVSSAKLDRVNNLYKV